MASDLAWPVRRIPQPPTLPASPGTGWIVPGSRHARPYWFDGRLLAAHDLRRDQAAFLARQARLGQAAGFGVVHGLMVQQAAGADTLVIRAGQGITPGGDLVMLADDLTVQLSDLPDEENLDVQFGLSSAPTPVARTRTGLYVLALRPVQFTADPISAYPTTVGGSPATRDGDVVEATAVSLVPFPLANGAADPATQQAQAARQIFLDGNAGTLSPSLLPVALLSLQRGVLAWLDTYMVRRESGPEPSDLRFGVSGPAVQQAFLLQYDAQLQATVAALAQTGQPARIVATDHFQSLPPAGRFPLASIDPATPAQAFFPAQMPVLLSLVPLDELPAVLEASLALPPIDLTLPAGAYADIPVLALVPVARTAYAALAASLPPVSLTAANPAGAPGVRPPDLLKLFRFAAAPASPAGNWQTAIGTQVYGFYVRQRSAPLLRSLATPVTPSATTLAASPIAGVSGVTLTATVSPASALGTVTFADGAGTLGTVGLLGASAVLVVPTLASGQHPLTATYNGDVNCAPSTSATLNQTVA